MSIEAGPEAPPRKEKALTIGAVCKQLEREFPDISISKIRYLEDQKLLSPRRTSGGYRLYSQADLARLRTILRLQRDEFLPLRVIRQELAAGRGSEPDVGPSAAAPAGDARPGAALRAPRRQQLLVLEVAHLRDRDLRELALELLHHGADRQ